jgi:[NiFe] hydrogenase assembly HybE family chaperone
MQDSGANIREQLEQLYSVIETTRMEGVPILNPVISVATLGFEPFNEHHCGVLLTPWFMNLMLVPQDQAAYAETAPKVGETVSVPFPVGRVDFIVGYEEGFGHSLSCSLFSPMFEFGDQDAAIETAKAVLDEVFKTDDAQEDEDADMREIWAGRLPNPEPATEDEPPRAKPADVSRRDFLRGGTATDQPQDQA